MERKEGKNGERRKEERIERERKEKEKIREISPSLSFFYMSVCLFISFLLSLCFTLIMIINILGNR